MSAPLLRVEGLSKKFTRSLRRSLLYGTLDIATELLGRERGCGRLRRGEFWAVRNVDLQLEPGQSLALIGANGCGKTTLLRSIGGLIRPDAGRILVRGRVAPLIALGAGFSPVLSGRENVFANMSILGVPRREIAKRFDDVLAFAELGDAIEAPVRTFSSGMAARLGFACAIHADPDVFLIDEVLAVGDVNFRLKCYRRLAELRARGTAFVVVSHNPHSLLSTCEHGLYMHRGSVLAAGPIAEVLWRYEQEATRGQDGPAAQPLGELVRVPRAAERSAGADLVMVRLLSCAAGPEARPGVLTTGEPAVLRVGVHAHVPLHGVGVTVVIRDRGGENETLLRLSTTSDKTSFRLAPGRHELRLELPTCNIAPGGYGLKLSLDSERGMLDAVELLPFEVVAGAALGQCRFYQPSTWRHIELGEDKAAAAGRGGEATGDGERDAVCGAGAR